VCAPRVECKTQCPVRHDRPTAQPSNQQHHQHQQQYNHYSKGARCSYLSCLRMPSCDPQSGNRPPGWSEVRPIIGRALYAGVQETRRGAVWSGWRGGLSCCCVPCAGSSFNPCSTVAHGFLFVGAGLAAGKQQRQLSPAAALPESVLCTQEPQQQQSTIHSSHAQPSNQQQQQ
jgi:hypothetical protein